MRPGETISDETMMRHDLAQLLGVNEDEIRGSFMVEHWGQELVRIVTHSDSNLFALFLKRAGQLALIVDEVGEKLCDEELSGVEQWEAGSNLRFEAQRFARLVHLISGVTVEE